MLLQEVKTQVNQSSPCKPTLREELERNKHSQMQKKKEWQIQMLSVLFPTHLPMIPYTRFCFSIPPDNFMHLLSRPPSFAAEQ